MTALALRGVLRLLTRALYRLTVLGGEHVPARGGALLVSNHLSFVDAFLIMAATSRPIRFVMHRDFYARRWIHAFARALRMIPIASDQQPRELAQSLRAAREAQPRVR